MMKNLFSGSGMKTTGICVTIAALTLLALMVTSPARAALINMEIVSGQPVVYDDVNGLYWLSNTNLLGSQKYGDQISTIGVFNITGYGGTTGWHLASLGEANTLMTALSGADPSPFFPANVSSGSLRQWNGRIEYSTTTNIHYYAVFKDIIDSSGSFGSVDSTAISPISDDISSPLLNAWVVTEVAPVPIPAAVWLLGSGLIGLVGIGRIRFKGKD